jgi:hypothetical protein
MKDIYTKSIYLVFLLSCGLFWQGCNIINPHEQTPTYVHVDSFSFQKNPLINSTASHQITQVWAYYNNNTIGIFDLPATFPVLTNGSDSGSLELAPAVVIDGQNNFLGVYPFYSLYSAPLKSQPGKIINYQPTTELYSNVKVYNISDFEGSSHFQLWGGNIPMTVVTDPSMVFEGGGSGSILLSNPGDSSVDSTVTAFAIPSGAAFIEFDYKSDLQFYVGLQANEGVIASTTAYYLAGIQPSQPSDRWQKFYLSVADFAAQYKGTTYNLYIKTSLSAGISHGRLLLDNIQLVTTH